MMITWGGLQDELAKRLPGLAVVAHACGVIGRDAHRQRLGRPGSRAARIADEPRAAPLRRGVIAFLVAGPSSWLRVQEACGPGGAVSRADSVGSRPRSILGAC
jgi:hypothetical protein